MNVENLTVSGIEITSPPGAFEGISLVDTNGTISGDTVERLEGSSASMDASVHAIEVKSTVASRAVTVTGNKVGNEAGHVGIDLLAGSPGTLAATVTGNTLTGEPSKATGTPPASGQLGIVAGGLASVNISANTISDYQSHFDVAGIYSDSQQAGAPCTVQGNTFTKNDDGIDLHGTSGCALIDNTITSGVAGIVAGGSSNDNVIDSNAISGTQTEGTTLAISGGQPIDGVLVSDGSGNQIDNNLISGFVDDAFVGQDPSYPSNALSTVDNSGNTFQNDSFTDLAGSGGYGLASLDNSPTVNVGAKADYFGCAAGPASTGAGCTPVSANVTYVPFAFAPLSSSNSGVSFATAGTATAANAGTTVSASGTGTVSVGQYSADPVGAPNFSSTGEYFDASTSIGNAFTSATVADCNLGGGTLSTGGTPLPRAAPGPGRS